MTVNNNNETDYIEASMPARLTVFTYVVALLLLVWWFKSLIDLIMPLLEGGEAALQLAIAKVQQLILYLYVVIIVHGIVLSVMLIKLGIQSIVEGYRGDVHAAFYDLFCIQDGQIIEHWDTTEAVPPLSQWQNDNSKF